VPSPWVLRASRHELSPKSYDAYVPDDELLDYDALIEDEATYPFPPFSDYVADHGTITGVCLRRPCPHHPA
jgi:hypothetical protein